jgi:ribosome-binding factor A
MNANRRARLTSVILQELAAVVPRNVKDPRVRPLTFTRAEVTEDGSQATIYVTLLGGGMGLDQKAAEKQIHESVEGLTSAAGFLRRHLGEVLEVRVVPKLVFREDRGLENANRVYDLLKQIGPSEPAKSENASAQASDEASTEKKAQE